MCVCVSVSTSLGRTPNDNSAQSGNSVFNASASAAVTVFLSVVPVSLFTMTRSFHFGAVCAVFLWTFVSCVSTGNAHFQYTLLFCFIHVTQNPGDLFLRFSA